MPACSPCLLSPVLDCSPILSSFQVILLEHIIMCRLVTGHKATALQEVGRKYREWDAGAGLGVGTGVKRGGYSDFTVTALAWAVESNVKPIVWFSKTCMLREHWDVTGIHVTKMHTFLRTLGRHFVT